MKEVMETVVVGTQVPQCTSVLHSLDTETKTVSKILRKFDLLWNSWELDSEAWLVVYDDGSSGIVGTNHGTICAMDTPKCANKLCEYVKACDALAGALHVADYINTSNEEARNEEDNDE